MTPVKKRALAALNPVGFAMERAWRDARTFIWRQVGNNTLMFDPDKAIAYLRQNLNRMVKEGIIAHWTAEVEKGRLYNDVVVLVRFRYCKAGRELSGSRRLKLR